MEETGISEGGKCLINIQVRSTVGMLEGVINSDHGFLDFSGNVVVLHLLWMLGVVMCQI